jgi:hypothetical protein
MYKNSDYEKANGAITLIKDGYSIIEAADKANAEVTIINIMLGNEDIVTEEVFVEEEVKLNRQNICSSCDKNEYNVCMVCACPLPTITNMKFKSCPLDKW